MNNVTSPQVLAVSTSEPRWIDMNGVRTLTSLVRDPSPVPLHFDGGGPEGNALALHTETVYAFPIERYAYWGEEFGLDHTAWPLCFWGENITLSGFHEDDVRVGDRLRFSGGVLLEVTGPRIPCTKMTWRLGLPASAIRKLMSVGGLGFYLRVIEGGMLGAGESIELTSPYPDNITITQLGRLHDRADEADLARLADVVATPRISAQSKDLLGRVIVHGHDQQRAKERRWHGWRSFTVADIREEAPDVRSVRLVAADGERAAPYRAGQFLPVKVPTQDGGLVTRTWSLSDYVEDGSGYRLSVKRVPGGIGSNWIHGLSIGDHVDARPPTGHFVLERAVFRPVVLISAGIGVTPMIAMLRGHLDSGFTTPLTWLHSTVSGETHLFRDEVAAMTAGDPQCDVRVHYSRPNPTDRLGEDFQFAGRIGKAHLAAIVEEQSRFRLVTRDIELNGRNREFYICGPKPFEDAIRNWLIELGVQPPFIRSETFDALADGPVGEAAIPEAEIRFAGSGVTATWLGADDRSLLQIAEAAGLEPEFGCRSGTCGACVARLVAGQIEHRPATGLDLGADELLLCCARPTTPQVTIDL